VQTHLDIDDVIFEPEERMLSDPAATSFSPTIVRRRRRRRRRLVIAVAERGEGVQFRDTRRGDRDDVGRVQVVHNAASRHGVPVYEQSGVGVKLD
jgi:hypothetical protein